MTPGWTARRDGDAPRYAWPPWVVLTVILVAGVTLAVSLPRKVDEMIAVDVTCLSGAAVVGVWVEAEMGGSGFSEPNGELGSSSGTYQYNLTFGGNYSLNVGCGGSRQIWKTQLSSSVSSHRYRQIVCDDTLADSSGRCRDTS